MTIILSAQTDSFASTSQKTKAACLLVSATVAEVRRIFLGMYVVCLYMEKCRLAMENAKPFKWKMACVFVFNLFKHHGKDVCGGGGLLKTSSVRPTSQILIPLFWNHVLGRFRSFQHLPIFMWGLVLHQIQIFVILLYLCVYIGVWKKRVRHKNEALILVKKKILFFFRLWTKKIQHPHLSQTHIGTYMCQCVWIAFK